MGSSITQGFLPNDLSETTIAMLDKLESTQRKELIRKCVHAFIVLSINRTQVKKADLHRLVFPDITYYKQCNAIIDAANLELIEHFGLRIYALDDYTKFILVNIDQTFVKDYLMTDLSNEQREEFTILYCVLMEIFISEDDRISHDEIKKMFIGLEEPFDQLDDNALQAILESAMAQGYLVHKKANQEDHYYHWGYRAYVEIDPDAWQERFLYHAGVESIEPWSELVKRLSRMRSLQKTLTR